MLVPDNPRSDRVSKCSYRVDLDLIVYRNVCTRSIRSWIIIIPIAIIPISLICNPDPSQSTHHRRYRVAPDRSASISISAFPHLRSKSAVLGLEHRDQSNRRGDKGRHVHEGKDGPVKTYLFREYPDTREAAITLAMLEAFSLRQAKLHANVPRPIPRPVVKPTGGPEPMDLSSATTAGPQQRRGSTNGRCFLCGTNGHYARECTAPVHAAKGRRDDTGYRHGQPKN
ncbi:unnamed protein product [Phytophthora fragariaefolia]|uniref:Unnamed protein product n=1 Tax=Phytophthora fragariaefolia TaxID=1490495 RepID=A0A9W6YLK3_9STRA|nr:unnamed protein product [Phytophthora fragariaefolia]